METNIQQWGNSLGIRIPKNIAQKLSLSHGSIINISIKDDHIALYPKKYNLTDMLANITEDNCHDLIWNEEDIKGNENW